MPAAASDIRRRRLWALGVLAGAAGMAGIAIGAGAGGNGDPGPPAVVSYCVRPTTTSAQVAGQGVMVRMEDTATPKLLTMAKAGEIGGVTLFPSDNVKTDGLKKQIKLMQAAARAGGNPPLLISIDQEGGIVKRLPLLPPQIAPYTLGQNDSPSGSALEGKATGFQLAALGIDVDLAPVLDVPSSSEQFMTPRAFGSSPGQVSKLGLAFAQGLMARGVAATGKHFPGLGYALENTDFAPTSIAASRKQLTADLKPFADAAKAGVPMIMVSSAAYPALGTGNDTPASLSPVVVHGVLRKKLGFDGVTISDDLLTPAISTSYAPAKAATLASRAGIDLKLFASKPVTGIAQGLARAASTGRSLSPAKLTGSCERIVALKNTIADDALLDG